MGFRKIWLIHFSCRIKGFLLWSVSFESEQLLYLMDVVWTFICQWTANEMGLRYAIITGGYGGKRLFNTRLFGVQNYCIDEVLVFNLI